MKSIFKVLSMEQLRTPWKTSNWIVILAPDLNQI